MTDALIVVATFVWIVTCASVYGLVVGEDMDHARYEAVMFGCASGVVVCLIAAALGALT